MTGLRSALILLVAAAVGGTAAVARATDWDPNPVVVSSGGENATLGVSGRAAVADASGRVCVVFQSNLGGDAFQVRFSEEQEDGTWSLPEVISGATKARNASMTVDQEGRLHAVWEDITAGEGDGEIVHRVRDPDGTWGDPEFVLPASGFSRHAAVTVDAMDRIQVVWEDGRLGVQRLLHAVAPAGGGGWSGPHVLSAGGVFPEDPSLAADGLGGVHVVWSDRSSSDITRFSYDVLYTHIEDPSQPPAPVHLVDHAASARHPCIEATANGTLHLLWLDDRISGSLDYFEVYYKRYLPGIGWGKDKRLTYNQVEHGSPVAVAGPGNTVNLAWEDYRSGTPDIFFRQITDARGWDRDPTQITADLSSSQSPTLVLVPGGGLTLIWSDAQGSGTFRVYAKDGSATAAP